MHYLLVDTLLSEALSLVVRVTLFELEEYESAKQSFETAMKLRVALGQDIAAHQRYLRKCDAEIQAEQPLPLTPPVASTTTTPPAAPAPAPVPAQGITLTTVFYM